jgi:hypothetical protein
MPANVTGGDNYRPARALPAMWLLARWVACGVQFTGRRLSESMLHRVVHAYEQSASWNTRPHRRGLIHYLTSAFILKLTVCDVAVRKTAVYRVEGPPACRRAVPRQPSCPGWNGDYGSPPPLGIRYAARELPGNAPAIVVVSK